MGRGGVIGERIGARCDCVSVVQCVVMLSLVDLLMDLHLFYCTFLSTTLGSKKSERVQGGKQSIASLLEPKEHSLHGIRLDHFKHLPNHAHDTCVRGGGGGRQTDRQTDRQRDALCVCLCAHKSCLSDSPRQMESCIGPQ